MSVAGVCFPLPPYILRILDHFSDSESKTVGRRPRRIVPPIWVLEISGMKMMRGDVESWSNSVEVASLVWVMEIDQTQVSSVIPKRERQRNSVTEGKDILK